ncbi:hypothetical protein DEO23_05495 [Brachybacterium endophyticum]|uniref:STAS domain-containing protein n=1 Tax=Brachybacterium endophyticum TaxID=2182385 RepID=A0A2U2RKR3_9MICO|nr:hypothetical protein [Brachybacterium endophyticum]PWH06426.1 hypothetical protein DEO23_05495 [Brachybacterium endophyticum]
MTDEISVLIRADVGRETIDVLVRGRLTEQTRQTLATQILKARTLDPASAILVDLTAAESIDAQPLTWLRETFGCHRSLGHELHRHGTHFLLPAQPSDS